MKQLRMLLLMFVVLFALSACTEVVDSSGPGKSEIAELTWDMLLEIDAQTGKASERLKALDGKIVKIPGYMAPIDANEAGYITEFVIVPYLGACIHYPPPPSNQMVLVVKPPQFEELSVTEGHLWLPFWFTGVFRLGNTHSAFGEVGSSFEPLHEMVEWQEEVNDAVDEGVATEDGEESALSDEEQRLHAEMEFWADPTEESTLEFLEDPEPESAPNAE